MKGRHGESKSSSLVVHPGGGDIATTAMDSVRSAINVVTKLINVASVEARI